MSRIREVDYRGYSIIIIISPIPPYNTYTIPSIAEGQTFANLAEAQGFIDEYISLLPEEPTPTHEPTPEPTPTPTPTPTSVIHSLRIYVTALQDIPPQGLELMTRLLQRLEGGGFQELFTQTTSVEDTTETNVAVFSLFAGSYAFEFRSVGLEPVEGLSLRYRLEIGGMPEATITGDTVIMPYYTSRYPFIISDIEEPLTPEPEEPATTPMPPLPETDITITPEFAPWSPILNLFNTASSGFINTVVAGANALIGVLTPQKDFFKDPIGAITNRFSELFQRTAQESINTSVQAIDEVTSHTSPWKAEIDSKLTNYTDNLVEQALSVLSPDSIGHSPLTPEEASTTLTLAGIGAIGVHTAGFIGGIVAESATLGQLDGLTRLSAEVLDKLGLEHITRAMITYPLEPLLLTPTRYHWNREFTPLIPPYTDLINMRVKEKITDEDFKLNLAYQGYSEEWANRIWDAHYYAPSFGDVRRAYYRGTWSQEQLLDMMKRVDLDPYYNETVWLTLLEEIPPVSEVINERVKEVIGDETFARALKFHGYSPIWGQRIWDAHFEPPTLGDILTAYRRGIPVSIPSIDPTTGSPTTRDVASLSISDVHELMVLVDLDPRYTDIFDTRLYRDPSIREARYMYETGAIDEARVREIVTRSGLDPIYIDDMVHYLTHFTERAYQRRYLTAITTAKVNDVYSDNQVIDLVGKAGFTIEVANWIIAIAQVRRDIELNPRETPKPRILTMAQLDKAYIRGIIDEGTYSMRMMQLGYETSDIALKTQILDLDKTVEEEGSRVIRLTTAQLLNAWRYEEMTEDDIRIELGLRGLDTLNIERLINTKKKQWGMEEA